jgi:hypothetical protein
VIHDVQDAPTHRDSAPARLTCTLQFLLGQCREHCSRHCPHLFQKTNKLRSIGDPDDELGVAVPGWRAPPHHLADPKLLRAGDVGGQNRHGVGAVFPLAFDGTPVQSFHRQVRDQPMHLPAEILDSFQVGP